jgi:hypothetical protein
MPVTLFTAYVDEWRQAANVTAFRAANGGPTAAPMQA